jgi:hypothetical protein
MRIIDEAIALSFYGVCEFVSGVGKFEVVPAL